LLTKKVRATSDIVLSELVCARTFLIIDWIGP